MKKLSILKFLGLLIPIPFLLGCGQNPPLLALGSYPIPILHEPRINKSDAEERTISANIYSGTLTSLDYIDEMTSGAASAHFTYRPSGDFSWLFVSLAASGSFGSIKLTCPANYYDDYYHDYTPSGCIAAFEAVSSLNRSYSFASIQELARVGIEANPAFFILGISAGAHLYQDFGQFEAVRNSLKKEDAVSGNNFRGFLPEARIWFGLRLGPSGKYGSLNSETLLQLKTGYIQNIVRLSLGYFHPTGWHGGAISASETLIFSAGKSFSF